MKKRKIILSATYSLGQISVGLVLHPYQTMQALVKEKVFIWMSLLPSIVLGAILIFWKMIIVPVVGLFFSCAQSTVFDCSLLSFLSDFIVFYCIYWQIMLLYLLLRFYLAFERK